MRATIYYLSSLDSYEFEPVRTLRVMREAHFTTGKKALLGEIHPPANGQPFGRVGDIARVLVTARFEGDDLFDIERFPCFVFVCAYDESTLDEARIEREDLQILGWAELYRTADDAAAHRFDPRKE